MMKLLQLLKPWSNRIFIGMVLVATMLRFYRLKEVPLGLTWDEAAISYNAWSIATEGTDEHGTPWPLSFQSFGDYKAPALIYFLAIIYKLFGLHPEWIRNVSAAFGVLGVVGVYTLTRSVTDQKRALVAAFFMAISAIAVPVSRVGFEASIAVTLVIFGMYFLLQQKHQLFGSVLLSLSLYTYHSTKIVVPLLLIIVWWFRKPAIRVIFLWFLLITPLIYDAFFGMGGARAATLIFSGATPLVAFERLVTNFKLHFMPTFWINGIDAVGLRHLVPGFGMMYWAEALLFLVGVIIAVWKRRSQDLFWVLWWVVALLPSLLSNVAPHTLRALLVLPAQVALAATGYQMLKKVRYSQVLVISLLVVQMVLFVRAYFGWYPSHSALSFQYGYREAIETAATLGKRSDGVAITTAYEHPYIYTLLFRAMKPSDFLSGGLADYTFGPIVWAERRPQMVYLGTPEEIPPEDPAVVKLITIPDTNRVVFVIAET